MGVCMCMCVCVCVCVWCVYEIVDKDKTAPILQGCALNRQCGLPCCPVVLMFVL